MPFGIMRVEKRKKGDLRRLAAHNLRLKDESGVLRSKSNPDIKPEETINNEYLVPAINHGEFKWVRQDEVDKYFNEKSILDIIDERMKKENDQIQYETSGKVKKFRLRKDSTYIIDVVIALSPNSECDRNKYFKRGLDYVVKKFGKRNLISAAYHKDERGENHLHVWFMPFTQDHRLSAKDYLGGPKQMQEMQEDYYTKVCQQFGLDHHKVKLSEEKNRKNLAVNEYKRKQEERSLMLLKRQRQKIESDLIELNKKKNEAELEFEEIIREEEEIRRKKSLIQSEYEQLMQLNEGMKVLKRVERLLNSKKEVAFLSKQQKESLIKLQSIIEEKSIARLNSDHTIGV